MSAAPSRPARVCYAVLSHEEPDLVVRLVRVLAEESDDARVLVRHDRSGSALSREAVEAVPGAHLLPAGSPAPWGSFSLTLATLDVVAAAVADPGWDWLVLLSGTSYPVRPLRRLAADLGATSEAAWLAPSPPLEQSAPRWTSWRPFGADRARYAYVPLPAWPVLDRPGVQRALLSATGRQPWGGASFHPRGPRAPALTPHLVVLRPRSVFRGGATPVRASQWWALSRHAAVTLISVRDPHHPWHRHFRRSYMSDETLPASWLAACGVAVADRPTHAQWWPSGASPAVLGLEHLPWLTGRSEAFARKVSLASGRDLLDELDRRRARG